MAKKTEKKKRGKFVKSLVVATSAGALLSSTALAGIASDSTMKNITPRSEQVSYQLDTTGSKPVLLAAAKKKVAKKKVAKKKVAKKKVAKKKVAKKKVAKKKVAKKKATAY